MLTTHVDQEVVRQASDGWNRRMDSRDELWNDLQPCVDRNGGESVEQGLLHDAQVTVLEPQSKQTQRILTKRRDVGERELCVRCIPIHSPMYHLKALALWR
jgi:hypothetical protein